MENTNNNTNDTNNNKPADCTSLFAKKILILTGVYKLLPIFFIYAASEFSGNKSLSFMNTLDTFSNSNVFTIIFYCICFYFIFSDESTLKKLNYNPPSKWLGLFPPLYFWKREDVLKGSKAIFWYFLLIIVLGYIIEFGVRFYVLGGFSSSRRLNFALEYTFLR